MNLGTDTAVTRARSTCSRRRVGSVVLAVNFPNNCDRSLLPDSAETDPAVGERRRRSSTACGSRARSSRRSGTATAPPTNWTEVFPTLASDADCNVVITRVVRFDDSGTTVRVQGLPRPPSTATVAG